MVKQKRNHTLAAFNTADLFAIINNSYIFCIQNVSAAYKQLILSHYYILPCYCKKYCKIFL